MDEDTNDIASSPGHETRTPEPLSLSFQIEFSDRINFAMQQHCVPMVDRIAVTNDGEEVVAEIQLHARLENGECDDWEARIARVEPGCTYGVVPKGLKLSAAAMARRTETERTSLAIVAEAGGRRAHWNSDVELLAFDQWPGLGVYPELLAAFVTPNQQNIAGLLPAARQSLGALSDSDALDGYQSESKQRAARIAEACFNAVLALGLGYINPPSSFDQHGQRVRLADKICRDKLGSCLDLSLMLAGLWEQVGLHPLVLLLEGHALPAVWTHETQLPQAFVDEPSHIRNLIELGELVPVEATLLAQQGATFAAAVGAARRKLESPGEMFSAIDIRACRRLNVLPLPLRSDAEQSELDLDEVESQRELLAAATTLGRITLAERDEQAVAARAETDEEQTPEGRVDRWSRKLLDLSLRNRLLNFRETGRTLRLLVPEVALLEDMLADDQRFSILVGQAEEPSFLLEEMRDGRLYSDQSATETAKRLLTLYRTARTGIEETGANLLHVAIGMLKWFEAESSLEPRYAPLILLPAQLTRHSTGTGYRYDVKLSDEPLRANVTLLEKLRVQFGINTQELDELPEDDHGIDVPLILRRFRTAIRDTSRWEVEESTFLGLFSFNKFLMWRDLKEHTERLRQSRLVTHLIDKAETAFDENPFPHPDQLDDEVDPGELLCTRDADSSQLAAVRAAAEQRTFVLEGPPGTGKSQTIANIIADSLARGKRVLFVAEKMAALTVVRRRLQEDGLGPFCLELHSASASKKEVLAQLREAMEADRLRRPEDWPRLCEEVKTTRTQLNTYVRELHAKRESGETLYQALGRISLRGDGPRLPLPTHDDIVATTSMQLAAWRRQVAMLVEGAASVDPVCEHPLRGVGRSDWSFSLPEDSKTALLAAQRSAEKLRSALRQMLEKIGVDDSLADQAPQRGVQTLLHLASKLLESSIPDPRLLTDPDWGGIEAEIRSLIDEGRRRDGLRLGLLDRYREEYLELDHLTYLDPLQRRASLHPILRFLLALPTRRRLRPFCRGRLPDLVAMMQDLETARAVRLASERLCSAAEASYFGRRWKDGEADWKEIEVILEWCGEYRGIIDSLTGLNPTAHWAQALQEPACQAAMRDAIRPAAKVAIQAWSAWTNDWNVIKQLLITNSQEAFGSAERPRWLPLVSEALDRWLDSLTQLNDWCRWRRERTQASQGGFDGLLQAYEAGDIALSDIMDAFERSYSEKWFSAVADSVSAIREFNVASHMQVAKRFRTADTGLLDRARMRIMADLASDMPHQSSQAAARSELGILCRELEKKRRHKATRRLIAQIPTLLAKLKPCFLMSPLSVAQYLDAQLPPFDLVVFDEASQIPVWDSIGAIARGQEVIVVGDSKQLPPTNFFNIVEEEDETTLDDEWVDMESILQECNASGIPAMRLAWHYRSRHESLIAFSNHHYYENKLLTFPSPEQRSPSLGVTLRHVPDGIYDRGSSRTNRIEADAVVAEVVKLLQDDASSDSIGIVTFSQAQQQLIEDLLDEQRRLSPEIEPAFSESREPVFVKNLENVQGDERDTIIFSVGYGPDQAGRHSVNFGPLNKDGGERRLNVAVTRARCRLLVFASFRADQLDLRRTRSIGVRHFKTFLDYADRGPKAIAEAVHSDASLDSESSFERAVWRALTNRDWEVDTQVGCAGYRIDLAIRDPERPGRHILGIECDGAAYHSAKTARDRDRLRQAVLEGLGWRIHRIWSTDWWLDETRCVAAIEAAVEHARTENAAADHIIASAPPIDRPADRSTESSGAEDPAPGDTPSDTGPGENEEPPPSRSRVVLEETESRQPTNESRHAIYEVAQCPDHRLSTLDVYHASSLRPTCRALLHLVNIEAPIVEDLAIQRLRTWLGIGRVTDRFRDRFRQLRDTLVGDGSIRLIRGVYWTPNLDPSSYSLFRLPGDGAHARRSLDEVPEIEVANAALAILAEQFGMPRADLIKETASLFGVRRVTSRAEDLVARALRGPLADGRLAENEGVLRMAAK